MNFRPRGQEADEPRIEITPLVDVVFLLLIFFLLTTSFVTQPALDVDLPETTDAPAREAEEEDLVVAVTRDGTWRLGGEPVTPERLETAFREAVSRNAETTVLLQADEGVAHGQVVKVMDLARRSGLTRLAIVTRSEGP